MPDEDRISIDIFKLVARAIAQSDNLESMAGRLTQLLAGALGIKGCTIFLLNPNSDELEILASFGLSIQYLNKGTLLFSKSIDRKETDEPIVLRDTSAFERMQYPEDARREGIGAVVSLPVKMGEAFIGVLRLYHFQTWDVSERDLDSLTILTEIIGIALMYTRLSNAVKCIKEAIGDIHPVCLER